MPSDDRAAPPEVPPKATLFCPACDHRSHVGGDWRVTSLVSRTRYRCPDCGTTVIDRPATARRPTGPTARYWRLWRAGLAAWRTSWRRMVGRQSER